MTGVLAQKKAQEGQEKMGIRNTRLEDLESVLELYAGARAFMKKTGNPTQWGDTHPQEALIRQDIERGEGYVLEEDGEIEAVFMFRVGEDPTYRVIEGGSWKKEGPYGVLHRVASSGRKPGAASRCIKWAFAQCGNLRCDTHRDNKVMRHVLEKNGFSRCGIIYLENGEPRIAYQKTEE